MHRSFGNLVVPRSLSDYARRPLETACSAEYFVALRSQRYGVAPSSRLDSLKHSAPIGRRAYSDRLLGRSDNARFDLDGGLSKLHETARDVCRNARDELVGDRIRPAGGLRRVDARVAVVADEGDG